MPCRSFCPRVVYHTIHADGIDTTEISDSIGFKECPILTLSGLDSALRFSTASDLSSHLLQKQTDLTSLHIFFPLVVIIPF